MPRAPERSTITTAFRSLRERKAPVSRGFFAFRCERAEWRLVYRKRWKVQLVELKLSQYVFFIVNFGEDHEICIHRRGACCDGHLRRACFGAKGGDQSRLLRAVLPERQLPELRTGKSLYGQLPEPKLANWLRSYGWLSRSSVSSRTPQALLTQKGPP
jgi:hypothetical protein